MFEIDPDSVACHSCITMIDSTSPFDSTRKKGRMTSGHDASLDVVVQGEDGLRRLPDREHGQAAQRLRHLRRQVEHPAGDEIPALPHRVGQRMHCLRQHGGRAEPVDAATNLDTAIRALAPSAATTTRVVPPAAISLSWKLPR